VVAGVVAMIVLWVVVGTVVLVGAVSSVAGRRRRRQQLARMYENPGALDAARAVVQARDEHRSGLGFTS
jgi:hypothetical protein